mmetsp:Transcript_61342/g.182724  ORF Transcript_61342/g.182724 Transcript_61342/m.182724 type:complete len:223 (+) Transcript_61342:582-1250(+)
MPITNGQDAVLIQQCCPRAEFQGLLRPLGIARDPPNQRSVVGQRGLLACRSQGLVHVELRFQGVGERLGGARSTGTAHKRRGRCRHRIRILLGVRQRLGNTPGRDRGVHQRRGGYGPRSGILEQLRCRDSAPCPGTAVVHAILGQANPKSPRRDARPKPNNLQVLDGGPWPTGAGKPSCSAPPGQAGLGHINLPRIAGRACHQQGTGPSRAMAAWPSKSRSS